MQAMAPTRRRNRTRPIVSAEPTVDHGPAVQQHAITAPCGATLRPILLVRESRADPDQPNRTVSGSRRRDSLRMLYASGDITGPQWLAAEDFRSDLALAGGASLQADSAGIRVAVTPGLYGPSDGQLDALTRAQAAHLAMGLVVAGVVSWVIIGGGSVRDFETCKGMRHGRGKELLLLALDRLSTFYTATKRR